MAVPSASGATVLWYNGDYDLNDAATNQNNVPINVGGSYVLEKALAYDNFVVPAGQSWSLTSLFSNIQLAYYTAPTTSVWEIRSGMSAGNAGTLLYSGDSASTATLENASNGNSYIDAEYRVAITVSNITLTAGTYWLALAPDSAGYYGDQGYLETTSGANAVGLASGPDGNSFLNNNLTSTGKLTYAASSLDYSAGVSGTATVLPEPSDLLLLAAGLAAVSCRLRRRS